MRAPLWVDDAPLARTTFRCACVCAGSLLFFDQGLYAFGVMLLITSLLQWRTGRSRPAPLPVEVHRLLWLAVAVIALVAWSAWRHDKPLRVLDNSVRLLLLPWCAWLACRTGVSRRGLWAGAVLGIAVAFCMACWQMDAGELRAGGTGNPIVFANLVLVLLAVALLLGPLSPLGGSRGAQGVAIAFALLAGVAIALSGSRGSLLAWAVLCLAVLILRGDRRQRRTRIGWAGAAAVGVIVLLAALPALHAPLRLGNVGPDVVRFAGGDADSPIGARLQFLQLAWQSFLAHPWQGVGVEGFGNVVRAWSGCQLRPQMGMCELEHAHNDLAEWAATLGLPGVLALLAIYGVPLSLFVAIIRHADSREPPLAAWAGVAVIAVFLWCGLTQSMFAHAATATAYALFTGVLLGLSLHEGAPPR